MELFMKLFGDGGRRDIASFKILASTIRLRVGNLIRNSSRDVYLITGKRSSWDEVNVLLVYPGPRLKTDTLKIITGYCGWGQRG